jgi:hypothetical protein
MKYVQRVAQTTFGTAICCIDGRIHVPLIMWMQQMLSVNYVDLITQPGPDALLAEYSERATEILRPSAGLSIGRHGSTVVAVVGHYDCAANAVDSATHRDQLLRAVRVVLDWDLGVKVMALWVSQGWQIDVVQTRAANSGRVAEPLD